MESLNWGIIGPGSIARDFARDLTLVHPRQNLKALLGHTPDNARAFAREFGVNNIYEQLEEFVTLSEVDIAYIATPHPLHFEQALACLDHNIHVLCEKPMTLNNQQCLALVDSARRNNCFLMEGMWIRFLPSLRRVLSLIEEEKIGEIISVKASLGYKAPFDHSNRYFNPELGGGSLLDLGIYPVFLAYQLLGKPDTIKAIGTLTRKGVDEHCSVLFHYRNGKHALLESSLISESDLPAEIAGEKGVIKIHNPWFEKSPAIELQLYDKVNITYPLRWEGHGLQFEIEETIRCIHEKRTESSMISHRSSIELSQILDEIRDQIDVCYKLHE